ncbi:ribulokinase [Robiginitalea sp. SC105]|uniref:ribulokinase n=1 Tax=Robiginitalea sp. SC105 TaxID=2762332 RepID=UPI0016398A84|nr:ribulokinase [Robiginitalea sp. SC105]MBC2839536.1 ribulokinase [Robiginitalea sp. SC105]
MEQYVIGLDYGTDSVRAVLIDTADGSEKASAVFAYPRWAAGKYCDPAANRFRQHPLDHIEGLESTIREVLEKSNVDPAAIRGICIDTTGSSPVPVTREGNPLALEPGFEENPNAMMVLWKDHTAISEAEEINVLARSGNGPDYTRYVGGIYSSEWFWAKILHVAREDTGVRKAAWSWMEHCDLMTHLLTGGTDLMAFKRSRCAAGHKAMWHPSWGGLPPAGFLSRLHPYLGELRGRLYSGTFTSDQPAGRLSATWARRLGLTTDTVVAVGTFDAHAGAVGARIDDHTLVRVMGTSTCDILVSQNKELGEQTVRGICGQVDGSVIPGRTGLEAGQSAFGDLLAWFRDVLNWPLENLVYNSPELDASKRDALRADIESRLIPELTAAAASIPWSESLPVALDWINGRRTPDANQELKSALANLSLGTKAPHIFKALVLAICFGSKKIVDRFEEEGVAIRSVIGIGGVARKSHFVMQTLADVLGRPVAVAASDQAPALGAAIYAAVAAGIYPDVPAAAAKMGSPIEKEYHPRPGESEALQPYMEQYDRLGAFAATLTKSD